MDVRHRNHVKVTGRPGAPVVMPAHGFGCDQNLWRLVVPALERDFTVGLFDHVGAGRSDLSAWSRERCFRPVRVAHDDRRHRAGTPIMALTECPTKTTGPSAGSRQSSSTSSVYPSRAEPGEELTNSFCRTDPGIARVTFLSDNRADLAAVGVPTPVAQCSGDAIAPPEVGAFVHARRPGSRLVTLNATGHCPELAAPEETAAAISEFAGTAR